ncbi:hypothetical protein EV648_11085 [Kribbella sp. VKM Ac-2568]|nr:hypothetical protein EV648_11085 [Kribbella sp. VKM Ac-2568]
MVRRRHPDRRSGHEWRFRRSSGPAGVLSDCRRLAQGASRRTTSHRKTPLTAVEPVAAGCGDRGHLAGGRWPVWLWGPRTPGRDRGQLMWCSRSRLGVRARTLCTARPECPERRDLLGWCTRCRFRGARRPLRAAATPRAPMQRSSLARVLRGRARTSRSSRALSPHLPVAPGQLRSFPGRGGVGQDSELVPIPKGRRRRSLVHPDQYHHAARGRPPPEPALAKPPEPAHAEPARTQHAVQAHPGLPRWARERARSRGFGSARQARMGWGAGWAWGRLAFGYECGGC